MIVLIFGIILFFSAHSVRIVADDWRARFIAKHGKPAWRGLYSVLSLAGLVLMIYGFGLSRADPVFVWNPPLWTRHLAIGLTLIAFILLAAGNVPRNPIRARLGHPMLLGIKVWAFAHLLANGRLGDILLFGVFLAWAIAGFASARKRDRREGVSYPPGTAAATAVTVIAGVAIWALFALVLHRLLIGVPAIA